MVESVVLPESQNLFELGINIDLSGLKIQIPDTDTAGFSRHPIARLGLMEGPSRLFQFGNINARTNVTKKRTIALKGRRSMIRQPAINPVISSQAVFHRKILAGVERPNVGL